MPMSPSGREPLRTRQPVLRKPRPGPLPSVPAQFDGTGALDITINVPSSIDGKDVRLVLWNVAQSNTFAATVNYRDTANTLAAVPVTNGRESAASANPIPFIYLRTVSGARMGEHHVVVTGGAGAWAFVVDAAGNTAGMTTIAGTSNTMYSVLAGGASPSATVNVRGGFVEEQVIVKTLGVAVTPASSEAVARPSAGSFSPSAAGTAVASTTVTTVGAISTLVFNRIGRPAKMEAALTLTLGNVATTYYNWAANGPYFTGTAAVAASAVTGYPKIAAGAANTMTVTASGRVLGDVDVAELTLDSLWWNVTIDAPTTFAPTTTTTYKTSPPDVFLSLNPSTDSFTSVASWSLRPGASIYVGAGLTYVNGMLRLSGSSGLTPANAQELAPVSRDSAPRVFIRIARRAGQPTTGLLTSALTYTTTAIAGSCRSYADCYKSESDHPALRYLLSADSQAARLRRCLLVPSEDDVTRPSAQCSECVADCDCGSGQYCHSDAGICTGSGGEYVCDSKSNSRFGLCVAKDPTGQIVGGACRSNSGSTFSTTTNIKATTGSSAIVANQLASSGEASSLVTGHGYCGGVAYYNSTNEDGANANGFSRANVARTVLWTGQCLDGICHECTTSDSLCLGAKTCIQGRVLETIVVDNTERTFTSNTLAGTMLAATLMIVLALIVVLADCICRHQWRSQDTKQRKLNHERRHRKKEVAKAEPDAEAAE